MLGRRDHTPEEPADTPMNRGEAVRGDIMVMWVPDRTVTRLRIGDTLGLTGADFERLAGAFVVELERRSRWPAGLPRCRSVHALAVAPMIRRDAPPGVDG